ncbi:MAG: hypothetical protein COV67_02570 [Nitrospinae bacterium CG11_big_fil_rev_8_21_14_0_20_56_8]|nr:MAG: hypothetical protein COV67_02570 [Nitrospinae bacterium CG11_big_fil_rev_8_21_14_0_20_56_8]
MNRSLVWLDRIIFASLIGFAGFSPFSISLTQISCGIGGLAWLARIYLTRSWRQVKLPLWIPLAGFSLACILAVVSGVDPANSFPSLKRLLEILIFFWGVNCIQSSGDREKVIGVLLAAGGLSTLGGFYHVMEKGFGTNVRVEGTMSVYMTFAGLLMMVSLVGLGKLAFDRPLRKWVGGCVVLMLACLLLTHTRQAWLGLLAGIVFLFYVRNKRWVLALPVIMVMVYVLAPWQIQLRMASMVDLKDVTLLNRVALWEGGWLIFKDHPLLGCGFKCVDVVHSQYPDPTGRIQKLRGMHNNVIQLMVDTGLVGMLSWLTVWVGYFLTLRRLAGNAEENDGPERGIRLGCAAAVLGFLIAGLFETNLYDGEVSMLLYFIMALPFAAGNWQPRKGLRGGWG